MKKQRELLLLLFDVAVVMMSYVLAIILRYDFRFITALAHEGFLRTLPFVGQIFLVTFLLTKTHKSLWDKISIEEGFRIVLANIIGSTIVILLTFYSGKRPIPISVIVIAFLVNTLVQEVMRFSYRLYRLRRLTDKKKKSNSSKRILIYGAGDSGALIAKEISTNPGYNSYVVGFVDDNPALKNKYVAGHVVYGSGDILDKIVTQQVINEIIVAMPSQPKEVQSKISRKVFALGLPVRIVPSTEEILSDRNLDRSLKKVNILDLLQRKEIVIQDEGVRDSIENQSILVTGAAGSIGSELVRQIIKNNPKSITLIDINENSLYELQQELKHLNPHNVPIKCLIASIRDKFNVNRIFKEGKFDLVFHAAAHKHVPLMEESPAEAIKNNIFGTYNLIEASKENKVKKFINISTDKAVNPTNVMGATKRFNEMLLQSQTSEDTKFMAVRFGNVLGSNGSVVPLFTKQIEAGGPITVTHKDITRYFMTIPEAVSLVLQAETYAKGGEIFVLDMGDPVKIVDLAEQMITLSGNKPYEDIEINFTGLRPGEKLYEELLMAEEGLIKTKNDLIFIAQPILTPKEVIHDHLDNLDSVIKELSTKEIILDTLNIAVPTYIRNSEA